jgi:hypothetical protein
MGTPALEGIIDEGTAEKIGGAKAHWPNIGWHVPVMGPDCETGRKRAHLRFGRRTGWRVFEQARTIWFRTIRDVKAVPSGVVGRTTMNYHGFCRGAPEELVVPGFSGKGFAVYNVL